MSARDDAEILYGLYIRYTTEAVLAILDILPNADCKRWFLMSVSEPNFETFCGRISQLRRIPVLMPGSR